jgi:GT2 family glycosyltransferase
MMLELHAPPTAGRRPALAEQSAARLGAAEPEVTVVIPVFNQWRVTQRCLRALLACDPDIAIQVVVVDDGSTDETPANLRLLSGIESLRNGENCGFVHSCNRGAALARGRYLFFLNNDTELEYGALRALLRRIERDDRVSIVGSKLVYPDGRLQEAGNIIWTDATGWNYGRTDDPAKFEYNFARDVDYVSAASLLIRTSEFAALGGFDTRFAPGYYEDADLCLRVRERGGRVIYEPTSVVIHHEGLTSGTDSSAGMKRYQAINQTKFVEKWEAALNRDHLPSHPTNVYRAARLRGRGELSLLIIDSYVPLYDKEAGSNRLKRLIDGLRDAGVRIVFLPDNLMPMAPYTQQLQSDAIEVIYALPEHRPAWRDLLLEALPTVDAVWICRPDLCSKYLPTIREHSPLPVIYDTIDLHHLRLRRQAKSEVNADDQTWRTTERLELACANAADRTVVVSDYEAALLSAAGIADVAIIPTVHDVEMSRSRGFAKTSGVVFIGGYNHPPNVDAATWLVREIMPLVWAQLPGVTVTLLGSNPPPQIYALAGDRVAVPGYVTDTELAVRFCAARVFAAPLRFGAGLKGKIGQALGFGTPIVSTAVGVEGFHLTEGIDVLVADSARAFAAAILRLYTDADLWAELSARSAAAVAPFGAVRVVATALEVVTSAIRAAAERARTTAADAAAASDSVKPDAAASDAAGPDAAVGRQGTTGADAVELGRVRMQLRSLSKREADLYLEHLQDVAEVREARHQLVAADARLAQLNADYATLLTVVSTLRRALEAVQAHATSSVQPAPDKSPPTSPRASRLVAPVRAALGRLAAARRHGA